MSVMRILLGAAAAAVAIAAAAPASAQFYLASKDLRGAQVRGDEPGVGVAMPGATDDEVRASLVWHLRAALNVGALQCQFEPSLLTVPLYNAALNDHKAEFAKSYDTLTKYFVRTAKTKKAGQTALDRYGTAVYSTFSTASPYSFCETVSSVGRDAIFQPRGSVYQVAAARMRELRNSLTSWGEQRFPRGIGYDRRILMVRTDAMCWSKGGDWNARKCGPMQWSYQ